jgi:hypothetical protein
MGIDWDALGQMPAAEKRELRIGTGTGVTQDAPLQTTPRL